MPFAFASYILCGLGYAFAAIQIVGFLGVFQEKTALFRRYVAINMVVLYAALSVGATYIAISAARHGVAVEKCQKDFFTDNSNITSGAGEGQQICNIFCWATLGAMGALLIILFIVQVGQAYDYQHVLTLYSRTSLSFSQNMEHRSEQVRINRSNPGCITEPS